MNKYIEPKVSSGYVCAPSSNRKRGGVGGKGEKQLLQAFKAFSLRII